MKYKNSSSVPDFVEKINHFLFKLFPLMMGKILYACIKKTEIDPTRSQEMDEV